jgi:hypothetical protein
VRGSRVRQAWNLKGVSVRLEMREADLWRTHELALRDTEPTVSASNQSKVPSEWQITCTSLAAFLGTSTSAAFAESQVNQSKDP